MAHVQLLMFILTNEIKSQLFSLSVENSFQIAKIDAWILALFTIKKNKLPQILNLKTSFGSQEGKNAATS